MPIVTGATTAMGRGAMGELRFRRGASVGLAALAAIAALSLSALANPPKALAYTGVNAFTATESDTQAGGHPDIELYVNFDNRVYNEGENAPAETEGCGCQDVQSVVFNLPPGFIGTPQAVPRCTLALFSAEECPPESQVGVSDVLGDEVAIYNMEPHTDQAALLAFNVPVLKAPAFIDIHARTGSSDYGLVSTVEGIYHLVPLHELHTYLWGVPAAHSHDAHRFPLYQQTCLQFEAYGPCFPPVPSNAAPTPFLQNPTTCGEDLSAEVKLTYYDGTTVSADTPWATTTGCDQLSFNPSLTAQPTTQEADTASGLDLNLVVPQTQSASVPSPSEIRSTTVTFPQGISINPNAADGKTSCSDAEGAFGTNGPAECPEFAKIGTDELESTALPGPISGGIYLGNPMPGDRYRIFIAADGYATHVKLAGSVRPDPRTGQIVTAFEDLPQAPFQRFALHFFGSERGLLATPTHCGTFPVESRFKPWDAVLPEQTSLSHLTISSGPNGSPCPTTPRPFAPQLLAGTADNTGGSHSPFTFRLTRADGDQFLSGVTVAAPAGLNARVAGIPYCPESAIAGLAFASGLSELATPGCPLQSQVGDATAGVGAGTHPLYIRGRVFLAGPYKGAPMSLVVVLPAVSGPYDLGTVAVRVAIQVDPTTTQITAISDPLPQILDGIPLRVRSIVLALDRPDLTINPTNCEASAVRADVRGVEGGTATLSNNFQVANCGDLGFEPKLHLRLSGSTKRSGNPALTATLRPQQGDANLRSTQVVLPHSELLDQAHISAPCTRVQFAAEQCPGSSQVGFAEARVPDLEQPLRGPVYLRSSSHTLPDLVVDLRGQLRTILVGRNDAVHGRLRSTFASLPDVSVSTFTLKLFGGKKSLTENTENICRRPQKALLRLGGQNGKRVEENTRISIPPCKGKARKRHLRHRRVRRSQTRHARR